MKVVVVGTGNQGRKRIAVAGATRVFDVVATVDPVAPEAQFRRLEDVPLESFDAALVCAPDDAKLALLRHLLRHGKHTLVEKPLPFDSASFDELRELSQATGAVCYTAYNHRFEPHLARLREILNSGALGEIYSVRMFYGNGTARDVRNSAWRDSGQGVLADLGSHLLDLVLFLFGPRDTHFALWSGQRFENRAFDHVVFASTQKPTLQLEATLLSWRNTFALEVIGAAGGAHVNGLCKWGPSALTLRRRMLPSGKPTEETHVLEQPDPTWALEHEHFKALCERGKACEGNLDNDVWINDVLRGLAPDEAGGAA